MIQVSSYLTEPLKFKNFQSMVFLSDSGSLYYYLSILIRIANLYQISRLFVAYLNNLHFISSCFLKCQYGHKSLTFKIYNCLAVSFLPFLLFIIHENLHNLCKFLLRYFENKFLNQQKQVIYFDSFFLNTLLEFQSFFRPCYLFFTL